MPSKLIKIDLTRRLYVLREQTWVSCLGFEVAERRAQAIVQWCGADIAPLSQWPTPGTSAHYQLYTTLMTAAGAHAARTGQRCPVELTPELIGLEGRTVRVTDCHGETRTFKVGRSQGWMPLHLEVPVRSRKAFHDSVTGAPFQSVVVL